MSASAAAANTFTHPAGHSGAICSFSELAMVVAISTEAGNTPMKRLPERVAILFNDYVKGKEMHCRHATVDGFVAALHPDIQRQLGDEPANRLRFVAKPLVLQTGGIEAARSEMGWKSKWIPSKQNSLDLGDVTMSGALAYDLIRQFWSDRLDMEVIALQYVLNSRALNDYANLRPHEYSSKPYRDYMMTLWNREGAAGLERLAGQDGFLAEPAWETAAGAFWTDMGTVSDLLAKGIPDAAKRAFDRIFRVTERVTLPQTSMFDPKFSGAKTARSRYAGDHSLQVPNGVPAELFRRLQGATSHELAALMEERRDDLLLALPHLNFPDLTEYTLPGGEPLERLPAEIWGALLPYLPPTDFRSLLYTSRRLNALLGNPNQSFWRLVVDERYELPANNEWHSLFQGRLLKQLLSTLPPNATPHLRGNLRLYADINTAQSWPGTGRPPESFRQTVNSMIRMELWAQLLELSARLSVNAQHALWFTVGQLLDANNLHDIIMRFDLTHFEALQEGISSRDVGKGELLQIAATSRKAREALDAVSSEPEEQNVVVAETPPFLQQQIDDLQLSVESMGDLLSQYQVTHDIVQAKEALKAENRRVVELFSSNPNLIDCYWAAQLKIEEVFLSAKAAAGGMNTVAEGALADVASKVEFFGEMIDLVPVIGELGDKILKHTVIEGLKEADTKRQTNLAKGLSRLLLLSNMSKEAERMARWLTLTYEPQLRMLAKASDVKVARGKWARGKHKVMKKVVYERSLSPGEVFAQFGVFCLFNRLRAVARGKKIDHEGPMSEVFVDVISSMRPKESKKAAGAAADAAQKNVDKALLKAKNKKLRMPSGSKLTLRDLYTRPGIRAPGGNYTCDWTDTSTYGYLVGTKSMAIRRGIIADDGTLAAEESGASPTTAVGAAAAGGSSAASSMERRVRHERHARQRLEERVTALEARLKSDDTASESGVS